MTLLTTGNVENAGRISTFTCTDTHAERLDEVMRSLGYKNATPSAPPPEAALTHAVRVFEAEWNKTADTRFSRRFARKLSYGRAEIIREDLNGEGESERTVVATATTSGITGTDDDVMRVWARVFDYFCEHIPSSQIGNWGEQFVTDRWGALPLDNRGHSVHIIARHAPAFDAWLAAMHTVTTVRATTFATVDSDPASLLAIVGSLRARVEAAIAKETETAIGSKTQAGREAASQRLQGLTDLLANYRSLAGTEVAELERAIDEARTQCVLATLA